MKSPLAAATAFLLAGILAMPAAFAQTVVTPQQQALGLPSGPYLLSCTGAHVVNGSLVALCDDQAAAQQGRDTWRTARLSLAEAQQCSGAVENINGTLTCGTAPSVGSSMPPQYYGSSFGTSGPGYGYSGTPAASPYTPPYASGASSSPNAQPTAPGTHSYPRSY
jgi:hypothetical protein